MPPSNGDDYKTKGKDTPKSSALDTLYKTVGQRKWSKWALIEKCYIDFSYHGKSFRIFASTLRTKASEIDFNASDISFARLEEGMCHMTGRPKHWSAPNIYALKITPFESNEYVRVSTDIEVGSYMSVYFDATDEVGMKETAAYWVLTDPGDRPPTVPPPKKP